MKRFWKKADAGADCWEWLAGKDKDGYGTFWFQGTMKKAHRMAYFLQWGLWPAVVRHTCDNPGCINPQHLEGGTQADNVQDCVDRDRVVRGTERARAKLTDEIVRGIRERLDKLSYGELAVLAGVGRSTIQKVAEGQTWRHV